MALKLYEIDTQIENLLQAIYEYAEDNEGEIPDDLDNALDQLHAEKEKKVLDVARYIKSLKAESEAIKTEADKLNKRFKSIKNFAYRLKLYLKMNLHTGEKYKDENTLITWRKSEAVKIVNEDIIPPEMFKVVRSPSISTIKELIKKGTNVAGAILVKNDNLLIK